MDHHFRDRSPRQQRQTRPLLRRFRQKFDRRSQEDRRKIAGRTRGERRESAGRAQEDRKEAGTKLERRLPETHGELPVALTLRRQGSIDDCRAAGRRARARFVAWRRASLPRRTPDLEPTLLKLSPIGAWYYRPSCPGLGNGCRRYFPARKGWRLRLLVPPAVPWAGFYDVVFYDEHVEIVAEASGVPVVPQQHADRSWRSQSRTAPRSETQAEAQQRIAAESTVAEHRHGRRVTSPQR